MTKLGQLREAEEKAQLEIDRAEKEAQRIRLSLPDLLEEKSRESRDRLVEIERSEGEKVEGRISDLSAELEKETDDRLRELSSRKEELEKVATRLLEEFILRSGKENP
ncbi:MAG: hypothetical protein JXA64_10985 [Candidatus Fermentibacteraceae bacterium]|nr:hypothetical protein [Candidatus Fermentibacteraceae bacterium]MBN2609629.1 hypothetical protein [Candidatus Fermentibacteraceae bacterium]